MTRAADGVVRMVALVLVSLTLLTACAGSSGVAIDCRGVPRGKMYAEGLLVERGNGPVRPVFLGVRCIGDDRIQITDSQGKTYRDIDDFRAHNNLLTANDHMDVSRRIPSRGRNVGEVTLSGHTSGVPAVVWWLVAAAVAFAAAGGAVIVLRRRDQAPHAGGEDVDGGSTAG